MKHVIGVRGLFVHAEARFVPAAAGSYYSSQVGEQAQRSAAETSGDEPHGLIQRHVNLSSVCAAAPDWGAIFRRSERQREG